ncbi:PIN domain-containing protein [Actinoallomurus purpureus]|uniref:PIN domain-containing protein n=1 Tax=Actinoallomurus purpureus TaxID=478114 RepID=UPI002092092A|nr:PIN domain-containing protein [Actinoallomurus purpureus]MCO6008980.1 PIN domain-containing protein [Actinoallomurus purpureus]
MRDLVVITPVVAQVWRDGSRQALLAKFLRRCVIEHPSFETAKHAGVLLGRADAADAVDALVVATAIAINAKAIITSDAGDIKKLCGAARTSLTLPLIERI